MPTLCGLRRRGYTPASIRNFCERIGVAKAPSTVEYAFLEHCLREDLNETAQRVMAVLQPVKLTITNYPEGQSEIFTVENNPNRPEDGTREVTFSRHLYDRGGRFPGRRRFPSTSVCIPDGPECRLKGAYLITLHRLRQGRERQCDGDSGRVRPRQPGRRPRRRPEGQGRHHPLGGCRQLLWTPRSACTTTCSPTPTPTPADKDFLDCLNPELPGSPHRLQGGGQPRRTPRRPRPIQFMRLGYFCPDSKDCAPGHLVFNRSVSLKDSFKPGK